MDLESECSVLESVEDNEVIINPERLEHVDGNKIQNNGYCGGEHRDDDDDGLLGDMKTGVIRVTESVVSSPLAVNSPADSVGSSPRGTKKGYGLKKWRRIRREFSNDGCSNLDTGKILKRGFSAPVANSTRHQGLSVDMRRKSDGSVSSTKAMVKSPGVADDDFSLISLDSRLEIGPNFAAGTDLENSEDQSSKSSTAASVPKSSYENRMRSLSGKNVVNVVQRSQKGKNQIETSKKPRGERVKIDKENSHSSMESDSRSSNFVFMQGTNSVTSNGRQSGRSMNYDGENSDEAQGGEELRTGYSEENVGEFEGLSQEDLAADLSWEVKEEKIENHRSSTDLDSLVESIFTLQSAQDALEKEIQKLKEIGNGNEEIPLFDRSAQGNSLPSELASKDPTTHEAGSSDLLYSGGITQISSDFLETQVISLKQNVNLLESKFEEANAVLKAKEAKVIELEYALKINGSPKEEMSSTIESQQKKYREMEAELEGLFKQKIEAEVEYLAISRTIQKLRVAAVDQVALFEERKTQVQMFNELGDAESKAGMLKRQAEKLETTYCEDIVATDQVLKLQKRVCKVTSCFFIQLILLFVVSMLFFLQLPPHYVGVVPT
ncbi:hypothetical protein ACSBR1_029095 [Camellia fascicularis]